MANREGDWWNGYRGVSDFQPERYNWSTSRSEWGFDPNNPYDKLSGQGQTLGDLLMQQAQGQGPSVAEQQMRAGVGRAISGMRGAAAGAPGMSSGLAQRLAGQQATSMAGQANTQAGMLRAQEMQSARSGLGQYLMDQLKLRAQGAMTREQLMAQAMNSRNALNMQQDLQNAGGMSGGGWGPALLNTAAGIAGAFF
jgi:hypothetical protein